MAKSENKVEAKKYYTVEIEALVPTIIKYRVLADSPEQAVDLVDKSPIIQAPITRVSLGKKIKAKVYDFGTLLLKFTKTF